MFDEELARKVGVAYAIYKSFCSVSGETPIDADKFVDLCESSIEEVRNIKGLVDENSVTG